MKPKLSMRSLIGNLIFIGVLLLIITRFLTVWSGTAFPINLISAGSMYPTLMEGDIVAWVPADIDDVEVGDVIVYKSRLGWPDEKFVIHRVIESKTTKGKTILGTKGDANKWTDQAGPHVVEPYITEDNFIGKTLSIGKQPLKIPLIGIIGIWINEGLRSLAQPTASKGSLTYVGVFTPLTISVILLLVSLYILPEKTKTAREKLRLLIFGAKTFDVKKIFVTFLVGYIVLLSVIHCFAYDSMAASLGVMEFPDESPFKLGSISPGSTTRPRGLPAINPGILPVKGIIFGSGELTNLVNRKTFELGTGEVKGIPVTATAPTTIKDGTYNGNIMIYSSPLWFMLPDEVMQTICTLPTGGAVLCLDILAACILTSITVVLIVATEYITRNYNSLKIDLSWCHTFRLGLKGIVPRISVQRKKLRHQVGKRLGWVNNINLAEIDPRKPMLASLVIIPVILFMSNELLAMIIASVTAGMAAYFISCKRRNKIVLASVLALSTALVFVIIKTNYYLISSNYTIIETTALGIGLTSLYLLIMALFLIPVALISWYITHVIRNLKERKDPLLILEGRCDL